MNTVLFYGGAALSVASFVAAIVFFFYDRIPAVFRYFSSTRGRNFQLADRPGWTTKTATSTSKNLGTRTGSQRLTSGVAASQRLSTSGLTRSDEATEVLHTQEYGAEDGTQLLTGNARYADDGTELLVSQSDTRPLETGNSESTKKSEDATDVL